MPCWSCWLRRCRPSPRPAGRRHLRAAGGHCRHRSTTRRAASRIRPTSRSATTTCRPPRPPRDRSTCARSWRRGVVPFTDGPWIRGNGTWDSTAKISVQGAVTWPAASVLVAPSGDRRIISGNGLPDGHTDRHVPDPAQRSRLRVRPQPELDLPAHRRDQPAARSRRGRHAELRVGRTHRLHADGRAVLQRAGRAEPRRRRARGPGQLRRPPAERAVPLPLGVELPLRGARPAPTLLGYAFDGFGIYNACDENGDGAHERRPRRVPRTTSKVKFNGKTQ